MRTALLNWLVAKKTRGEFFLRIEDTDRARSTFAAESRILSGLAWIGITPDGPTWRQSRRLEVYRERVAELVQRGLAYPCFCSEDDLAAGREADAAAGRPPRYSGACRAVTPAEAQRRMQAGEEHTIRMAVPEDRGTITFHDLVKGPMEVDTSAFGDFVLQRSSGWPSYTLAVVVDDLAMRINLVLRGEDHLTNTARQILLYEAFEAAPPAFAHHGLLLDTDRKKLSKRGGAPSVHELEIKRILPHAVAHYLAALGGAVETTRPFLRFSEMTYAFDPDRMGGGGAVFDVAELANLNTEYLHKLPAADILRSIKPFPDLGPAWETLAWEERMRLLSVVQENLSTFGDLRMHLPPLIEEDLCYAGEALAQMMTPEAHALYMALGEALEEGLFAERAGSEGVAELKKRINAAGKKVGAKGKGLWHPLRLALTGKHTGPDMDRLLANIPYGWIRSRIATAEKIAKSSLC